MTNTTTTNNPQMRAGFTMIELIFVIVIIGILASVAIPKLAATRDDAKISKMANAIQTAKSEIATRIIATNNVPASAADIRSYSNTISEAVISGDAEINTTTSSDMVITFIDRDSGNKCKRMHIIGDSTTADVNISIVEDSNASAICTGVNGLVPNTSITVGGTQVTY